MKRRLATATDVMLMTAALTVIVVTLNRQTAAVPADKPTEIEYLENWKDLSKAALWSGDSGAAIQIIEFVDMECAACRSFSSRLEQLRVKYGERLSLGVIHYPLPRHRFARVAAHAVECAAEEGDPSAFISVLYAKQDSIGLKTWGSYSADARMQDTAAVGSCVASKRSFKRIDAGVRLGKRLKIPGTPTLVVNGWVLPPNDNFERAVALIADGRPPTPEYRSRVF